MNIWRHRRILFNPNSTKMKKAFLTLASVFVMTLSYSQSLKEEVQIFQNVFGKEKKATAAQFIKIEDAAKKDAFWALYDAYETERKALGEKRIALVSAYVANYNSLTDDKIEAILMQSVKVNEGLENLVIKYYKKMKKPVGIKTAAQFAQVENYFLAAVRYELSAQLPFIGEGK